MPGRLADKVAIITGAGSIGPGWGNGKATAVLFAREGAKVLAAFAAGCKAFDASLGGLGGCPYAPGATGNIVLEDTVFMFESMGLETGIDLEKLAAAREIVHRALPEVMLYGAIAKAGLPRNFHPVAQAA